jgi:sporulation protein YlmC with PRC-barrel domain
MDVRVRRATELLTLRITHKGIDLGQAVDLLLDLDAGRAVGLEVLCHDNAVRFLPLGAGRLGRETVEVGSPLGLVDDLAFYRARGLAFRGLRGAPVMRAGASLGLLSDILVRDDGAISRLVVDTPSGEKEVPPTQAVSIAREQSASAA